MQSIESIDIDQKRVLVRVDLNVPIKSGVILNDARIRAIMPTLDTLFKKNAAIILLSHLGRPTEGVYTEALSLKPIADRLSFLIQKPVRFEKDWLAGVTVHPGEIVLCENVRFNRGEKDNDLFLAQKVAALGDVFVMDAFATAHRSEASTVGIIQYAPLSVAGPLFIKEINALKTALKDPKRPVTAIVGGAKVSDKSLLLTSLIEKVDVLILGGGLANTFIAAQGHFVGDSLIEPNFIQMAEKLIQKAKDTGVELLIPLDAVLSTTCDAQSRTRFSDLNDIKPDEKILDVGPKTVSAIERLLVSSRTIIWNGPLGVFEYTPFSNGTKGLALAIEKAHSAFSLAGGGETLAAIEQYGIEKALSYISTGGGAFLEYLEGRTLPVLAALVEKG